MPFQQGSEIAGIAGPTTRGGLLAPHVAISSSARTRRHCCARLRTSRGLDAPLAGVLVVWPIDWLGRAGWMDKKQERVSRQENVYSPWMHEVNARHLQKACWWRGCGSPHPNHPGRRFSWTVRGARVSCPTIRSTKGHEDKVGSVSCQHSQG